MENNLYWGNEHGYYLCIIILSCIIVIALISTLYNIQYDDPNTDKKKIKYIKNFSTQFISYIKANMYNFTSDEKKIFKRLIRRFNPNKIYASSVKTFSFNKGTYVKFCTEYFDENIGKYVILHEMSHIASKKYGHTNEFWCVFKTIIRTAVNSGLYEPVDYKQYPESYCGINIDNNIYYSFLQCDK